MRFRFQSKKIDCTENRAKKNFVLPTHLSRVEKIHHFRAILPRKNGKIMILRKTVFT